MEIKKELTEKEISQREIERTYKTETQTEREERMADLSKLKFREQIEKEIKEKNYSTVEEDLTIAQFRLGELLEDLTLSYSENYVSEYEKQFIKPVYKLLEKSISEHNEIQDEYENIIINHNSEMEKERNEIEKEKNELEINNEKLWETIYNIEDDNSETEETNYKLKEEIIELKKENSELDELTITLRNKCSLLYETVDQENETKVNLRKTHIQTRENLKEIINELENTVIDQKKEMESNYETRVRIINESLEQERNHRKTEKELEQTKEHLFYVFNSLKKEKDDAYSTIEQMKTVHHDSVNELKKEIKEFKKHIKELCEENKELNENIYGAQPFQG